MIYKDNVVCVAQIMIGYIKRDKTKYISSTIFYTHELQKIDKLILSKFALSIDLQFFFTKSSSTSIFEKLVYDIGLQRVNKM